MTLRLLPNDGPIFSTVAKLVEALTRSIPEGSENAVRKRSPAPRARPAPRDQVRERSDDRTGARLRLRLHKELPLRNAAAASAAPDPCLSPPFRLPVAQLPSTRPPRVAVLGCFVTLPRRSRRPRLQASVALPARGVGGASLVGRVRKRAASRSQKILHEVRTCATVERYRKSTLGLMTGRRSQRGKCSASRSGGDTNFLQFGQTPWGLPDASLVPGPVRCFSMTQQ